MELIDLMSPEDGSKLQPESENILIDQSGNKFFKVGGKWNLKPKLPKAYTVRQKVYEQTEFSQHKFSPFVKPWYPQNHKNSHDPKESNIAGLLEPFPLNGARCPDHGCGGGQMRGLIEELGYVYIGIDSEVGAESKHLGGQAFSGGADYFVDLHSLPFPDSSFKFAISYSVFEHLQCPIRAAQELYRVLEPGGRAFLAIASLIPFHMDSFYHHTHFGVLHLCKSAGFDVLDIAPADWNAYIAIGGMDGLPGPKWVRHLVSHTTYQIHKGLWKIRRKFQSRPPEEDELFRQIVFTGIIIAHIQKPLLPTV